MSRKKKLFSQRVIFILILIGATSCNYNYYRGKQLEKEERYEEANVEFHRAYTSDPNDEDFIQAYRRTAIPTVEDLIKRYKRFLREKKFLTAFQHLERAQPLEPHHEFIVKELPKWLRVLLAGKVSLEFKTLRKQVPLADEMALAVRFNTPDPTKRLYAKINNQTGIFAVEDVLYNPPQDFLMLYSISTIGVRLVKNRISARMPQSIEFKNFINLRTPVLVNVSGKLERRGTNHLLHTHQFYPYEQLIQAGQPQPWVPPRGIRYTITLEKDVIRVQSSVGYIDFIPQILYLNQKDQRVFLDFGHLVIIQKSINAPWSFKRVITKEREYYQDLEKNIILNPYFYYREGGYPFLKMSQKTSS